jgi:protein-S-isoprenylcysteine O-methyltransferase Ste14
MNLESVFHLLAVVLLLSTVSISIYHRHKAAQTGERISTREEGSLILNLRRLFGLAGWLGALVYLINPDWMAWSSLPLPAWLRWTGAALMAVCLPLVYWVFSSLGKNVTPTVVTRKEHALVTHGPYRWVRHPLYTVGSATFIGFSLLAANWFIPTMLVLAMSVLLKRTPIEEAQLIERFGDEYRQYMQTTGRYLPRLKQEA